MASLEVVMMKGPLTIFVFREKHEFLVLAEVRLSFKYDGEETAHRLYRVYKIAGQK